MKRPTCRLAGVLILVSLPFSGGLAGTHYVVPTGTVGVTPTDPFTSWMTAGTNIAEVVTAALTNVTPRQVWVADGTYSLTNTI